MSFFKTRPNSSGTQDEVGSGGPTQTGMNLSWGPDTETPQEAPPYRRQRQNTSDYVKLRQITTFYDILRCRLVKLRQFTSNYDILRHIPLRVLRKLRQITSNYVKLRQITSKYDILRSHDHIMNISKFNFKLRQITAFHDIFRYRFFKLRQITSNYVTLRQNTAFYVRKIRHFTSIYDIYDIFR